MAETIALPPLGFNVQEGTFVNWTKQVGDTVAKDDTIAEVEADKATIEVPAPSAGVLLQTLVNSGDTVHVGAPIAVLGAPGEKPNGAAATTAAPASAGPQPTPAPVPPVVPAPAPASSAAFAAVSAQPQSLQPAQPVEEEGLPNGMRASPLARKMAEERGIDLRQVRGTGPSGRIVKSDVDAYVPAAPAALAPAPRPTPAVMPVPVGPDVEEIPLTRLRSRIAARMTESKQTVPHFYVTTEIDMAAAVALRKQINEPLDDAHKVSVNDLVVKAAALTLRDFPNLNTHFYGDRLVRYKHINIGIAVALDKGGLMNVVVKDADLTPISRMAAKTKDLIAGARAGKVKPDDIEGSTFTVSNLGPYDVEVFSAIINPPEAAILAVASARQVPVVVDGTIQVGTRMKCTLSVDHRVSDGAEGARFLQAFKQLLEAPLRLLI